MSAAFRKMAERCSQGMSSQALLAARAASTAIFSSLSPARQHSAMTWLWSWGMVTGMVFSVQTSFPPMMRGILTTSWDCLSSSAFSSERSGLPGR